MRRVSAPAILLALWLAAPGCAPPRGGAPVSTGQGPPASSNVGAPGAPLARAAAQPHPVDPGQCPVVGRWQGVVPGGILAGGALTLVFRDDGIAEGTVGWVSLTTTWERRGDLVAITDVRAVPAMATCPSHQVGTYTLDFAPNCEAVRVINAQDECNHRRMTLNGLSARRR